jgi:hypothetical protein
LAKKSVWENQLYYVHPEILSVKLWKLPFGLVSNLYRVLNAQQQTMVQDVSTYAGLLIQENGDQVMVQDEDIIRHANAFPLIFKVRAQATEQGTIFIGLDKFLNH